MKILQLIQAKQYRGAEIFCCQLSNHLVRLGHEVMVVSIYGGNAMLPFKQEVYNLNRPKNKRFFDRRGWWELSQIIKEFNPDILQANAADTLKYAVFSKFLFKWEAPIVYRNASASSFYIKNKLTKRLNAFLLKRVNSIISVSEASKNDLNQLFPFTSPKTSVIPIGIENEGILNKEVNFKKKHFNIVHVGSFTREKNHRGLLKIFKEFQYKNSHARLHLIGDGELREEIESLTGKMNLCENVIFHGEIKEPLPYINEANVLALPSIVEGLPAVILEAMYCKTPVIAYNVGGVSEILNKMTGSLVQVHNSKAFVEALQKLKDQPDYDQIENAFLMVNKNYLNKKIARKFIKEFQNAQRILELD